LLVAALLRHLLLNI